MAKIGKDVATSIATGMATSIAGGNAPAAGWAPTGYSALFETVAPSVITLDTAPTPDEVSSWVDSTGNFTAAPTGNAPSYPYGTPANGIEGVEFDGANSEALTAGFGVSSTDTYAIFFALRVLVGGTNQTLLELTDSSATRQIQIRVSGTTGSLRHLRNALSSAHTSSTNVPSLTIARLMVAYDGTNSIVRVEGASEESQAIAAGSHDAGQSRIGMTFPNSQQLTGGIYAIAVYGGASGVPSSSSDRAAVWAALGTRFGL